MKKFYLTENEKTIELLEVLGRVFVGTFQTRAVIEVTTQSDVFDEMLLALGCEIAAPADTASNTPAAPNTPATTEAAAAQPDAAATDRAAVCKQCKKVMPDRKRDGTCTACYNRNWRTSKKATQVNVVLPDLTQPVEEMPNFKAKPQKIKNSPMGKQGTLPAKIQANIETVVQEARQREAKGNIGQPAESPIRALRFGLVRKVG